MNPQSAGTSSLHRSTSPLHAVNLEPVGHAILRYGVVLVLFWIGAAKFTTIEAEAIKPFVANSPLMSFVYSIFSVGTFSAILGVVEIIIGLLLIARHWSPVLGALGAFLAAGTFLTTLTFLFSTPGIIEAESGWFLIPSAVGGFVMKDFVLLGASVWMLGDALNAMRRGSESSPT